VLVDELATRLGMGAPSADPPPDKWLDARRAAAYVGLSLNALHKLTAARDIPFHQDGPGCKLWFRRPELDEWRMAGGARQWKRSRFQIAVSAPARYSLRLTKLLALQAFPSMGTAGFEPATSRV
jgi:hypothetical protein